MDNRYYESVINEMKPFLDENGFKKQPDGSFLGEKKAVKVSYDEARQMYLLYMADVEEGTVGEYSEISAWLFDDTQNERDASSVGIDFIGIVRDKMGIKLTRATGGAVELPNSSKNGSITAFAKKVLDVYPQFKDAYKEHIAKYGNFLYLNFFCDTLVVQIKSVLTENNKKAVKKLCGLLENAYIQGDKDTVNVVVACLSAACVGDEKITQNAISMLGDNKHFINSLNNFISILSSNKKLKSALIKN